MKDEEVYQLVKSLIVHEEKLKELYLAYSKRFPEHKETWEKMAHDEQKHAKWIRALAGKMKNNQIGLSKRQLNTVAVRTSTDFLEKEIARAREGELNMLKAVSIASNFENAMIEKGFFEIFDLDNRKFKKIKAGLERETRRQRRRRNGEPRPIHYPRLFLPWASGLLKQDPNPRPTLHHPSIST